MNLEQMKEKYNRLFYKLYGMDLFYADKNDSPSAALRWLAVSNKEISKLGIKKIRQNEKIMSRSGW